MKKLLLVLILLLLLSLVPSRAFAKDASLSATPINVVYDLPYPGILPDNPLYYLKAIRDNLLKFFISDPLKKSEFDLLQANKRLGAAQALLSENKTELAITTLSKSGNYFDDAISAIQLAKKQGEKTDSLLTELSKASQKHQLIIRQMEKGKKGDVLLELKFLEDRAHDFWQRVEIIKSY